MQALLGDLVPPRGGGTTYHIACVQQVVSAAVVELVVRVTD